MWLFFWEILYKDVINRIFLYIVVKTVMRIIEPHQALVLAPEFETVIHPFTRKLEILAEDSCLIQWTRPKKFPFRRNPTGDDVIQDQVIRLVNVRVERMGYPIMIISGIFAISSFCRRKDWLQQLLILGCKKIILIAHRHIREYVRSKDAGVDYIVKSIYGLCKLPVLTYKEKHLIQADFIVPDIFPIVRDIGKCLIKSGGHFR